MPAALGCGEQAVQQRRAAGRLLVQCHGGPACLRHDGEEAGPGGGFEHAVARPHLRGGHRDGGELRRRGELVQRHLLLAAARLRRRERGQAGEQRRDLRGCVLETADLRGQATDLKHHRRLDRVVGVLPRPRAFRVRRAEGHRHRGADEAPVERAGLG